MNCRSLAIALLLCLLPSFAAAEPTYTFRIVWSEPMRAISKEGFYEGIRQGMRMFSDNYNVRFKEVSSGAAQIYVTSAPICHNAGALYVQNAFGCYPWPGIYFSARDTRTWSVHNIKIIHAHEMLHLFHHNGTHYHSPDINCVSNSNANTSGFCAAEDKWLAARFGRRPVPRPEKPTISIDDVWVMEGDSGITPMLFTVSLSHPWHHPVTVDYTTVDDAAIAGEDYVERQGTLAIAPGDTSRQLLIKVLGDTKHEKHERFFVHLYHSRQGLITKPLGKGFIANDDDPQPLAVISEVDFQSPSGAPWIWSYQVTEPCHVIFTINGNMVSAPHVVDFGKEQFGPLPAGTHTLRLRARNEHGSTYLTRQIEL